MNDDPDRMDVDKISIKRLTTQERECYFKEGRCFTCGQKRHRANECPKKPTRSAPNRNQERGSFFNRNNRFAPRYNNQGKNIRQTETTEAKPVEKQEETTPKPVPKEEEEAPVDPTKEQAASIRTILKFLKPEEQDAVFNLLAEEGF